MRREDINDAELRLGGDAVLSRIDAAQAFRGPHQSGEKTSRAKLLWLNEVRLNSTTDYIIKGVFHRRDLGILFGPSEVGKSFFYTDLAMHIACDREWRGHRVRAGGVLIVVLEGQRGMQNRLIAQRTDYEGTLPDGTRVPLALWQTPIDFCHGNSKDAQLLVQTVRAEFAEPPCLIVIDTLARAMSGDENNSQDMGRFVRSVDYVREATGAHVLVVHHTGKDVDRGPRGHSSLRAAADLVIEIERLKDASVSVAKIVKQKDGPEGEEFPFTLRQVEIGTDDEGDPITSCLVIPSEVAGGPTLKEPKGQAGIALKALRQAIDQHGEPALTNHHIPRTKVVRTDLWARYCQQLGLTEKTAQADSFERAFRRSRQELQTRESLEFGGISHGSRNDARTRRTRPDKAARPR